MDKEMMERGVELLMEVEEHDVHAVTIDHNKDISALAFAMTVGIEKAPDFSQQMNLIKCFFETVFYLGYLAGKNEGDLSVWEEQL